MSVAPLPVCELDDFCDLPPGHGGDCRQPFCTADCLYCATMPLPGQWIDPMARFEVGLVTREEFLRRITPIDPSTVTQGNMFS